MDSPVDKLGDKSSEFTTTIKQGSNEEFNIDIHWVVLHNDNLCKMFNTHINVEYCNTIKYARYVFIRGPIEQSK